MTQQTPQQAIDILTQATAQLSATREVHAVIQQALQTLQTLITEKE
jgi:hypothetical protein